MARFVAVSANDGKIVYVNADTVTMVELRKKSLILRIIGMQEHPRLDFTNEEDALKVLESLVCKPGEDE